MFFLLLQKLFVEILKLRLSRRKLFDLKVKILPKNLLTLNFGFLYWYKSLPTLLIGIKVFGLLIYWKKEVTSICVSIYGVLSLKVRLRDSN